MARALEGLALELDPLRVTAALRGRLDRPLARAAAELHEARRRAVGRFPCAENGFFTRKGVEQMSRTPVAALRATWIRERLGRCTVLDATCGVGGDSVALAQAGLCAVSMDRDFRSALCTSENLRALGLPDRTLVGAAEHAPLAADVLVLDPDRRPEGQGGRRTLDPELWSPSLSVALGLAARYRGACIKLAPAIDADKLVGRLAATEAASGLPWSLEWVDVDRELCEVTLWTGDLARRADLARSALSLETADAPPFPIPPVSAPSAANRLSGIPEEVVSLTPAEVSGIRWLAEPNPSVIRSGLVGFLARSLGMAPIGPGIAWLGGPERPLSPFVRTWRVLDSSTVDRRRVRAMLSRHDIGPIVVKKRGHPDRPEVLERRLRGSGRQRGLVAIARLQAGHAAFLLESPMQAGEDEEDGVGRR